MVDPGFQSFGKAADRGGSDNLTVAQALRDGARRLSGAGIDNPRLESRLLLAHAMNCSSEDLIRDQTAKVQVSTFDRLVARRAAHEPIALIRGWKEFWSLRFQVSSATLIPRADSETLIEAALALCPDARTPIRVLDLGTGSGCLLLAFLHERQRAYGVGIDRSEAAASLARRNASELGLADRSTFVCGDWASSISARFDLILSNPPYVATPELLALPPEVRGHESITALDGGADGLAAYRAIITSLPVLLPPSGSAVLELGAGQGRAVAALAEEAGFLVDFRPDLAGIDRAIILRPSP